MRSKPETSPERVERIAERRVGIRWVRLGLAGLATFVVLLSGAGIPTASAIVVPEVRVLDGPRFDTTCTGSFVSMTTVSTEWHWKHVLLILWGDIGASTTWGTTVQYTFQCTTRLTLAIEGSGGVDQRVGFYTTVEETQSTYICPPFWEMVDDQPCFRGVRFEQEDVDSCSYLVGSCGIVWGSESRTIYAESGASQTQPLEVRVCEPGTEEFFDADVEFTAYSAFNTQGVIVPLVTQPIIAPAPSCLNVPIQWSSDPAAALTPMLGALVELGTSPQV